MHTLLVLTDFSEASSYAASYTCVLARQFNASNIVLYHSATEVISPGDSVAYPDNEENLHHVAVDRLIELSASLLDLVPADCEIRYRTDSKTLDDIDIVIENEQADLIIMATTGKGKVEDLVAGSNAIMVFENSSVPVILVPLDITMDPVGELVFACDLKETITTIPKNDLNTLIRAFHVPVSVLHIGDHNTGEQNQLSSLLDDQSVQYYNVSSDDTAQGILDFTSQRSNALIVVVARKHGFPFGWFHNSVTKQLAFQSTTPIAVLKEVETPVPVIPLFEI